MNRVLPTVLLGVLASSSLASLACSMSQGDTYSGTWAEINGHRRFTILKNKDNLPALDGSLYSVSGCVGASRATLNGNGDLLINERDNLGIPRRALLVYDASTGHLKGQLCGGDGEWTKQ